MAHLRLATVDDIPEMVRIRAESVRELAAGHYPAAVIDDWSRPYVPGGPGLREGLTTGAEVSVVATSGSRLVGFGSLVPALREVRRVYVEPSAARQGVGTEILRRLESIGRAAGTGHLVLDASLNAEAFYVANGYRAVERCTRRLATGRDMTCVRMLKVLDEAAPSP